MTWTNKIGCPVPSQGTRQDDLDEDGRTKNTSGYKEQILGSNP